MEKRKGSSLKIGTKITIWIIVVILVIGGAVSALMYTAYADGQMELAGLSASRVVATAGAQIDGDQIERYTKTLQKDGDYAELFELLSETKSISQFEYLYIIADLTPEHFTYIASGSDDKKLENEPLKMGDTDERSIFGSELGETLSKGVDTLTEPLSYGEEYGNALMLSAFYPIKNSQGKVVAALGADVNVDIFMEEVSRKMLGVFLIIGASIVGISIAIYIISALFIRKIVTKPLNTLSSAAQSIAGGNFDVTITHKANDEMGDVVDAFMSVIETLDVLRQDAVELRESATRGHILHRLPDNPKIKGAYQEIVNGMHGIMDTFIEHLHALPIGIGVMDKEYRTLFCNHAMAQIGGLSADNLNGKKCSEFLASDVCNTEECPGRHTLSSGERCLKDVVTGSLDFEIQTAPIKGMDGQIEGFLEVAIDQTTTMQNQREVTRQAQAVAAQVEVSRKQSEYQAAEVEGLIRELEELAHGDFEINLVHAPYDEDTKGIYENFSKISGNLETSCKNIKSYIAELTDVLDKVASKDLNVEITREYVGDFTQVKESINHITDSLSEVFAEIAGATKQVQEGSTRVANTSQGLAQGASEQASAVQQISATIAEVAEQTKRNAQNAKTANQISLEARTDLQTGSERMDEMVTAMQAIKEASNGIASIIKVIEDIAFQTNILALNAAVEAARAGEHGKGFAVVAEEVRSLAARSASAAKETTEMIDNSLSKVEVGSRIALETAEALEKVVKGVGNTAEIVAKIAEASAEQAASIAQINNGVDQISKVTQANTATAEESAAASQQMSGQSQVLQGMINEFEIKSKRTLTGNHSGTGRLPSPY